MTKKEMFAALTTLVLNSDIEDKEEILDKLSNEIAQLEKKAATPRKPTANQIENESLAAEIVAYLTKVDTLKSIKEMQEEVPSLSALSNQRISHILSALVNAGKLEKSYVKKTPFFCVK